MPEPIILLSLGLSAAATDAAVATVFLLLWRLDRPQHLVAFGLSFAGVTLAVVSNILGTLFNMSAVAEAFSDAFFIASLTCLTGGCLALAGARAPWRALLAAACGVFLIARVTALFGFSGIFYLPFCSGLLYALLAFVFRPHRNRRGSALLAPLFAARAVVNLPWPLVVGGPFSSVIPIADQVVIVTIGLVLIVSDLIQARRLAETATAQVTRQAEALKMLNRQLVAERAQADAANRAKSEFLANISHELRTPLNAVIGFSDVLGQNRIDNAAARSVEYGRLINAAGQHLLAIISDILDMSRIEAGKVSLRPRPIDLQAVVHHVIALTSHRAQAREIDFSVAVDDGVARIEADEQLLKQVLINLLTNAFKYTEPGGIVRLTASAAGGDRVAIAVRDTGVGIAPDDLPHIFDPFFFSGSALTRRNGGIGLGLSITKRLVELHRGTIEITSEVGRGTVVTVLLPMRQSQPAPALDRDGAPLPKQTAG